MREELTYHWIAVGQEILQLIQESLVLDQGRINVIKFGDAHGCGLAHIRVLVLQALTQRLAQILGYLVNTYAAHRANC